VAQEARGGEARGPRQAAIAGLLPSDPGHKVMQHVADAQPFAGTLQFVRRERRRGDDGARRKGHRSPVRRFPTGLAKRGRTARPVFAKFGADQWFAIAEHSHLAGATNSSWLQLLTTLGPLPAKWQAPCHPLHAASPGMTE
jgi:hypothetical protein